MWRLFCRLGWHFRLDFIGFDGCTHDARCRTCGTVGMVDSQGNLF